MVRNRSGPPEGDTLRGSNREPAQHSQQFDFALAAVPDSLRRHGLRAAHPRPLVSHGKRPGRPFTSCRMPPNRAWSFPDVEYGNAGSSIAALVLDCDNPEAMRRGLAELPDPNWIVRRVENGHAHPVWTFAAPIHRYPTARIEPLRHVAHIADYYATATGADPGYTGVLAHNPTMPGDSPYRTTWGRRKPYPLDELASVIPFGWQPPAARQTGVGRNCDLFASGMAWAGRQVHGHLAILPALLVVNQEFEHPLPLSEVQTTAKQIEKYRRRWASRGWHSSRWIATQAARSARQTGKARKASASPTAERDAGGARPVTLSAKRRCDGVAGARTGRARERLLSPCSPK